MGGGIAQVLALAGFPVALADVDAATAEKSRDRLITQAAQYESLGLFPAEAAAVIAENLSAAPSIERAVADADYITEAVPEIVDVKLETLRRISSSARPEAIIGTNTSAIPIDELAKEVCEPARFLGVHWMNPAPFIPGVELIASTATDSEIVDAAEGSSDPSGKSPPGSPMPPASSPTVCSSRSTRRHWRSSRRELRHRNRSTLSSATLSASASPSSGPSRSGTWPDSTSTKRLRNPRAGLRGAVRRPRPPHDPGRAGPYRRQVRSRTTRHRRIRQGRPPRIPGQSLCTPVRAAGRPRTGPRTVTGSVADRTDGGGRR